MNSGRAVAQAAGEGAYSAEVGVVACSLARENQNVFVVILE
jgi:hypothetical protein